MATDRLTPTAIVDVIQLLFEGRTCDVIDGDRSLGLVECQNGAKVYISHDIAYKTALGQPHDTSSRSTSSGREGSIPSRSPNLPKRSHLLRALIVVCMLLVLLVIGIIAASAMSPQLRDAYLSRFVFDLTNSGEEGNALRIVAWQYAIQVWQRNPLLGAGFGTLGSSVAVQDPSILAPESMYLKLLGELGVIGLLLYMLTIIPPLVCATKRLFQQCDERLDSMAIVCVALVGAMLVGGLVLQNWSRIFWPRYSGLSLEAYAHLVMGSRVASIQKFDGPLWQTPGTVSVLGTPRGQGENHTVLGVDPKLQHRGVCQAGHSECAGGSTNRRVHNSVGG